MNKCAPPFWKVLFLPVLFCFAAPAAPLVTSQNSTLSIPGNRIAMTAFPWATNLSGPNFMLSSVALATPQGGKARLVNALQWSRRYSGGPGSHNNAAYAAAPWGGGGVVVCGPSYRIGSDDDFATVCYGADGTAVWTNRYDGPVLGHDLARFVAASAAGEVWTVGESQRELSFFPQDIVVIKYASNGIPAWTNRLASFETNSSHPWGLTVDATGHAYVTEAASLWVGFSGTPVGEAITKFDPQGNVVWKKLYPDLGPDSGESIHQPGPVALDDEGNLIVAGESGRPYYSTGRSIMKFAGDGTAMWTNHRPPAIGFGLRTINLDSAGHAIITGDRFGSSSAVYEILKCSSGGVTLWTNEVAGPGYLGGSVPQAIPDAEGNVFFIGGSPALGFNSGLYQVLKFSSNGVPLWTNQAVRFGTTNGTFHSAAVDNAGHLFLVGSASAPGQTDNDIVLMKYSADGLPLSTNRFAGAPGAQDYPFAFVVDAQGNALISGSSGNSNFVTLKYADALVYTPPADFAGLDNLTCTLTDTVGHHATGAVEVLVLPGSFQFDLSPNATRLTPTGLHLQLSGLPGTNAVILETSPDLISWQRILTNVPVGNSVEFLAPSALTFPRRFYRAIQQP